MHRVVACVALAAALGCQGAVGNADDDQGPDAGDGTMSDAPPFSTNGGPYFTQPMFWNRDVSAVPKASNSDSAMAPANHGVLTMPTCSARW